MGGGEWGEGTGLGARVSEFFLQRIQIYEKRFSFWGLAGGGEGARVSDFFTKDPNIIFGEDLRGGGG